MPYLLNLIYLAAAVVLAPWLCWQAWVRKKPIAGLHAKWFGVCPPVDSARPTAWFHAVSVGEIHLLRQVVAQFRVRFPDWQFVVSTTTRTGYEEACKHFGERSVVYWPFDFTWAVHNALDAIRPKLVVLSEGEIWPNFVTIAKQRGLKVVVLNGRMSPRSAKRFRLFRWLLAGTFAKLDWIGAQNVVYREQYEGLGARHVVTTGNIKYDGVQSDRRNTKTQAIRNLFDISADALVWVAGSTQDPEEGATLEIYRHARAMHPKLRLLLVPRHPERFDEVARLLERSGLRFVRRSAIQPGDRIAENAVILVDTIGELGAIWGLADIAYVGGSLDGKRGGQNMIEPSAYGAAVLFGPHTWNFKQTVADLLARDAAIQVQDIATLKAAVLRLLDDAAQRQRLGEAARAFVVSQQGATAKSLEELQRILTLDVACHRAA